MYLHLILDSNTKYLDDSDFQLYQAKGDNIEEYKIGEILYYYYEHDRYYTRVIIENKIITQ